MKMGYSLLLLDHVEAASITYDDCRAFQIVCPICREPVFKVVQSQDDGGLHYLSHHASDRAYAADCEMRVAGLSPRAISAGADEGKGQRLRIFMGVLRDAIEKDVWFPFSSRAQAEFSRSKALRVLGREVRPLIGRVAEDYATFELTCREYLDDLRLGTPDGGGDGRELLCLGEGHFSVHVQVRAAFEVYRHLLTETVSPNYDFVWQYATNAFLFGRVGSNVRVRGYQSLNSAQTELVEFLMGLLRCNRQRGLSLLEEARGRHSSSASGGSVLSSAVAKIIPEFFGALLRVPYADLLRQAHANRASNGGSDE